MITEKEICLKVDTKRRIRVDDVINMLKGLRNETSIEIIRIPEENVDKKKCDDLDTSFSATQTYTSSVTGNTEIPQIRELNEIASILRSMGENEDSFSN